MYTAGGNGQPSAEPTTAPVPSASRIDRRLYSSPATAALSTLVMPSVKL
jgi:hypothetical protein